VFEWIAGNDVVQAIGSNNTKYYSDGTVTNDPIGGGISDVSIIATHSLNLPNITVNEIPTPTPTPVPNSSPTAIVDSVTVTDRGSVVIDVAANDTDEDGDALAVSAYVDGSSGVVLITNGGSIGNNDGQLTYTHTGGCSSTDSFTYSVTDGKGGYSSSTVVNVTITGITPCDTTPPEIIAISVLPASGTNSAFGDDIAITVNASDSQSSVRSATVIYRKPDGFLFHWNCYIGQPAGSCTMLTNVEFGVHPLELTGAMEFVSVIVEDDSDNSYTYGPDELSISVPDIFVHEDGSIGFIY